MPGGYPLTEVQGSKTNVIFRFARFDADLDYDPFLTWGSGDTDGNAGAQLAKPWALMASLCGLCYAAYIMIVA